MSLMELDPALLGRDIAEIMRRAIDNATRPLKVQIAALEARLAGLEAREPQLRYLGTWEPKEYFPGNFCTHQGSTWACMQQTTQRPGSGGPHWVLAVKKGQDAR